MRPSPRWPVWWAAPRRRMWRPSQEHYRTERTRISRSPATTVLARISTAPSSCSNPWRRAVAAGGFSWPTSWPTAQPASVRSAACGVRTDLLANVLLRYSLDVRLGQVVLISGMPAAEPLILSLFRQTIELGALPVIRVRADLCLWSPTFDAGAALWSTGRRSARTAASHHLHGPNRSAPRGGRHVGEQRGEGRGRTPIPQSSYPPAAQLLDHSLRGALRRRWPGGGRRRLIGSAMTSPPCLWLGGCRRRRGSRRDGCRGVRRRRRGVPRWGRVRPWAARSG